LLKGQQVIPSTARYTNCWVGARRQTSGANAFSREGNNPERRLRLQSEDFSENYAFRLAEVVLETDDLYRKRKSSG